LGKLSPFLETVHFINYTTNPISETETETVVWQNFGRLKKHLVALPPANNLNYLSFANAYVRSGAIRVRALAFITGIRYFFRKLKQ
jgi:hypothetical protein